jgi:hypothetical protein
VTHVLACLGIMSVLVLTFTVSSGLVSNGYHKAYARGNLDALGTKIRESINNQITEELSGPNPPSSSGSPTLTVTARFGSAEIPAAYSPGFSSAGEGEAVALCNPDEVVTGGGFARLPAPGVTQPYTPPPGIYVENSTEYRPAPFGLQPPGVGWEVWAWNTSLHPITIEARALCASLAP